MRVKLRKRPANDIDFGIIYGMIAVVLLGFAQLVPVLDIFPSCPFRQLSGMPCPTCGATHSVVSLSSGHVADAIIMNPLVALCFLGAVCFFFYRLTTMVFGFRSVKVYLTQAETAVARAGIVVMFILNWIYLAWMARPHSSF